MPRYELRILLETVEGKKTSYYSSGSSYTGGNGSFIDTDFDGLVLSSSQVYNRITSSVSCSFQNQINFTGNNNDGIIFKQNNLLSASLTGSLNTGSLVFTALDTEYDRLLRYKFIGEKVTNTLGLPSDQWVYVDQVRLPADDEANIFQGNANLGNTVITDTLTFAGGSNVNSDVPILIDTGSDRYIKFVDERATSVVALRMGYDADTDTYEISGSPDFTTKIGGFNEINVTAITSSFFWFKQNKDGGNAVITIENTNDDTGSDKGAGIEFRHNGYGAGAIIAGKDGTYSATGGPTTYDSNLQFFTTLNGTDTEKLRITSDGEARFTGNISASGDIIAEGDIIAQNYIVQSTVTQITTSFSSGSNIFGDTPADDTHQFTGSVFITGSSLIVDGNISASGDLFKTKFVQMTNSSSVIDTFNTGSFRSAKYTLQVTSASNYQVSELLVLHHNSTASNTEYAQINSGLNLIDFTTDISNSDVRLNAAGSFISCSVRLDRIIIPT
jgi:hypothetical protein